MTSSLSKEDQSAFSHAIGKGNELAVGRLVAQKTLGPGRMGEREIEGEERGRESAVEGSEESVDSDEE